jgi:tripartite-type tricarboxylate transporter receptor subunit TctC
MKRRLLSALLVLATAEPLWAQGTAEADANAPITVIIPFATGGSTDALARLIGDHLAQELKRPFVMQNIGGAGSTIGLAKLASARPDGLTVGIGTTAGIVINPLIRPRTVQYKPLDDFVPITRFTQSSHVLVVSKDSPFHNVEQLVAAAKAKPGNLTFGTPGIGTNQQLAAEMLQVMTGTKMVHVPYTGSNQVLTDLIGGRVDFAFDAAPQLLSHIKSGKLKVLGYTGPERPAFDKTIPTIGETVKGFSLVGWHGFFAPARTPMATVDRLSRVIQAFMARPDTLAKFEALGTTGVSTTQKQFATFLAADIERTRPIVMAADMVEP